MDFSQPPRHARHNVSSTQAKALLPTLAAALFLSACSNLQSQTSPDVIYSETALEARSLQVPPDLTDVSDAEQFVLPGTVGSELTRNTLLPQFDNARFVRDGAQSWLEFEQTPEDLWPQLLSFARSENYQIEQTEPVAGVIVTQWRSSTEDQDAGLLSELIPSDEQFTRVAFRLERDNTGSRLFARSQAAAEAAVSAATIAEDAAWPASSHDPEQTSALLSRFLVFLGVEQQKARGILGAEQARAVLDGAIVQSNASGSEMIVNRGYQSSFNQLLAVVNQLDGYSVTSSDDSSGRIVINNSERDLVLELSPIHVSAVSVSVVSAQGARLPSDTAQQVLSLLAQQLV